MELKEAYIEEIICHHFSVDPAECLMNNSRMNLAELDTMALKDFFIKPFSRVMSEYTFSHPVGLSYNVVYQTVLKLMHNEDFVSCSQDVFRQLQISSKQPSIKDGDLFIAKISDVIIGDTYYDGLGIFKIEQKREFIETYLDEDGKMQFAIKNGFSSNKLDKACLIIFQDKMPKCLIIDTSKDTKYWRQDFLGLTPMPNAYSQTKAATQVFQLFVNEELSKRPDVTKEERVNLLNSWSERMKTAKTFEIEKLADDILPNDEISDMFSEYCKAFADKEGYTLSGNICIEKKALSIPKKVRTIKLDDTVEISLIKTGKFIERGFDKERGMNYYKLYFSKEK